MIGKRIIRNTRARLARVVAFKVSRALQRGRVRNAARHAFTDGAQHIQHALLSRADSNYMFRVLRQSGCEDTRSPAYSIERERAIQTRADRRDPNRALAHVRRNANGKLVKIDLAAGFCRDDGHDVPLAKQWADNAGKRAVQAILQAGKHRAAMRDAIATGAESKASIANAYGDVIAQAVETGKAAADAALNEHLALSDDLRKIIGKHGTAEAMMRYAMRDANDAIRSAELQRDYAIAQSEKRTIASSVLANTRAKSAMIRAELDAARAMASLSGKAKRKMRDQLRAAKHAAR